MIQGSGNFAFVTNEKDGFDVGEIKAKTRSSWDFDRITAYECQTNAISDELNKSTERESRYKTHMIFVTSTNELADKINEVTHHKYECVAPS